MPAHHPRLRGHPFAYSSNVDLDLDLAFAGVLASMFHIMSATAESERQVGLEGTAAVRAQAAPADGMTADAA